MTSLAAIRSSNSSFFRSALLTSSGLAADALTAVFVGGTSGIGEGMALTYAQHTEGKSNIVIVGRNRAAAERIFASMPAPSPGEAKVARDFVQCDVAIMKNVQSATQEILARYPKINFLILSPGTVTLSGRDATSEGIDKKLALHYYARWKFTQDLLPALKTAVEKGQKATVMSVLSAGQGGKVDLQDLGLEKGYSLSAVAKAASTYNDMMMESFAEQAPNIAFIHAYPGFVRTPIVASSSTPSLRIVSSILMPLLSPISISPLDCGEYMWHAIASTATKPGAWRTGKRGENVGKKGYFVDTEGRKEVWKHTEEVVTRAVTIGDSPTI